MTQACASLSSQGPSPEKAPLRSQQGSQWLLRRAKERWAAENCNCAGPKGSPSQSLSVRPKKKAMPVRPGGSVGRGRPIERAGPLQTSQAPGRGPAQAKKMPKKPGRFVTQVKKEAYEAAGLLRRRREAARRKGARKSWRARQKEALVYFAAQRREDEAAPAPNYEVDHGARLPGPTSSCQADVQSAAEQKLGVGNQSKELGGEAVIPEVVQRLFEARSTLPQVRALWSERPHYQPVPAWVWSDEST